MAVLSVSFVFARQALTSTKFKKHNFKLNTIQGSSLSYYQWLNYFQIQVQKHADRLAHVWQKPVSLW